MNCSRRSFIISASGFSRCSLPPNIAFFLLSLYGWIYYVVSAIVMGLFDCLHTWLIIMVWSCVDLKSLLWGWVLSLCGLPSHGCP